MTFAKSLQALSLQAFCIIASTFAAGTAAHAGFIQTPAIFQGSGNQIICVVTNATNAPVTATVRIVGVLGSTTDTCTIDPNDPGGCQVFRNNDAGFCRISVAGLTAAQIAQRLRAILFARKTVSPFTIESLVEAR